MMKAGDLVKIRRELSFELKKKKDPYSTSYAIDVYGLILKVEDEEEREEKEKMDHPMIPSMYTRTLKVTILKTNKEVPIAMYVCKEDKVHVLGRVKENK
jgi:hypothetical protein